MIYDITPSITGTALANMDAASVRQIWQQGIDVFEQSNDFFAEMEGGQDALIWEKTDLAKGKGQKITFTVGSGFYAEPHVGDEVFEGQEDFEDYLIKSHELYVDWARHGVSVNERMEELMGMRGEILSGFNTEQGAWIGRLKTEQLFMMFREQLPAANVVYAGGASLHTLNSSNTLNWDEIITLGVQMKGKGGLPAKVGTTKNGQPVFRNTVIATTDALFSLDLDPNYKQILRETRVEAQASLLFDGGYASPKGHLIAEYTPIDHDGEGAIGSPLNPKAQLGVAITPGTAAITVKGGGNPAAAAKSRIMYFKYFPNFAYRFIGNTDPTAGGITTLEQDSATHYFLIVNAPNDSTKPNGIGMYSYTTGNNGNGITITGRLASASSGIASTTLGQVTWNTGVWQGRHTTSHDVGATILPCNAKGQVFGDTLMLGKRAAYRGYGKYRNQRMQQDLEGGFLMQRYIASVFGQALRKDRLGRVPAVMRLRHAVQYAGIPLPTVV
jgi:hypothetical protein